MTLRKLVVAVALLAIVASVLAGDWRDRETGAYNSRRARGRRWPTKERTFHHYHHFVGDDFRHAGAYDSHPAGVYDSRPAGAGSAAYVSASEHVIKPVTKSVSSHHEHSDYGDSSHGEAHSTSYHASGTLAKHKDVTDYSSGGKYSDSHSGPAYRHTRAQDGYHEPTTGYHEPTTGYSGDLLHIDETTSTDGYGGRLLVLSLPESNLYKAHDLSGTYGDCRGRGVATKNDGRLSIHFTKCRNVLEDVSGGRHYRSAEIAEDRSSASVQASEVADRRLHQSPEDGYRRANRDLNSGTVKIGVFGRRLPGEEAGQSADSGEGNQHWVWHLGQRHILDGDKPKGRPLHAP